MTPDDAPQTPPALTRAEYHDLLAYRLRRVEIQVDGLERKVDRLVWALTVASLSFAGATAVLVVTAIGQAS